MKKNKLKKIFNPFLIIPVLLSILFIYISPHVYLSKGDQYFNRLTLWNSYAQTGNWLEAYKLEPKLDPIDIQNYKNSNDPQKISQTLEKVISKKVKTADDWIEIARLQIQLNQKQKALESLKQAQKLDPVRDDISKLYLQLSK